MIQLVPFFIREIVIPSCDDTVRHQGTDLSGFNDKHGKLVIFAARSHKINQDLRAGVPVSVLDRMNLDICLLFDGLAIVISQLLLVRQIRILFRPVCSSPIVIDVDVLAAKVNTVQLCERFVR